MMVLGRHGGIRRSIRQSGCRKGGGRGNSSDRFGTVTLGSVNISLRERSVVNRGREIVRTIGSAMVYEEAAALEATIVVSQELPFG